MKKMTDSAKTLVLLRKHSILNVYERGSVYLDHKKFYGGGFQTYVPPCTIITLFPCFRCLGIRMRVMIRCVSPSPRVRWELRYFTITATLTTTLIRQWRTKCQIIRMEMSKQHPTTA